MLNMKPGEMRDTYRYSPLSPPLRKRTMYLEQARYFTCLILKFASVLRTQSASCKVGMGVWTRRVDVGGCAISMVRSLITAVQKPVWQEKYLRSQSSVPTTKPSMFPISGENNLKGIEYRILWGSSYKVIHVGYETKCDEGYIPLLISSLKSLKKSGLERASSSGLRWDPLAVR